MRGRVGRVITRVSLTCGARLKRNVGAKCMQPTKHGPRLYRTGDWRMILSSINVVTLKVRGLNSLALCSFKKVLPRGFRVAIHPGTPKRYARNTPKPTQYVN